MVLVEISLEEMTCSCTSGIQVIHTLVTLFDKLIILRNVLVLSNELGIHSESSSMTLLNLAKLHPEVHDLVLILS